ncbi:MAG: hypothetical protein K9N07_10910 [Candidatus Cloacimonetes bacterium]|nr:hypothetical protein [Candidatus Cloacimonadota bacterium]
MLTSKNNPKIILEDKEYELEKIHISELNYLMVRLFNPIEKNYITYNLGDYNPENNFIKDEIEKIQRDRTSK